MTRTEFVELHRHQIAGLVLDAATHGKTGGELSVWLRGVMAKIDAQLGRAWDSLHSAANNGHDKPAAANGKPEVPRNVSLAVHRG